MRPFTILTEWSCEELLVAWAIYANRHSQQYFESVPTAERRARGMKDMDRWAVPFFSEEQVREFNKQPELPPEGDLEDELAAMQHVNDIIMGK